MKFVKATKNRKPISIEIPNKAKMYVDLSSKSSNVIAEYIWKRLEIENKLINDGGSLDEYVLVNEELYIPSITFISDFDGKPIFKIIWTEVSKKKAISLLCKVLEINNLESDYDIVDMFLEFSNFINKNIHKWNF